jgi:hypothetical protein
MLAPASGTTVAVSATPSNSPPMHRLTRLRRRYRTRTPRSWPTAPAPSARPAPPWHTNWSTWDTKTSSNTPPELTAGRLPATPLTTPSNHTNNQKGQESNRPPAPLFVLCGPVTPPNALGLIKGETLSVERTSCPSVGRFAQTGKMPMLRRRPPTSPSRYSISQSAVGQKPSHTDELQAKSIHRVSEAHPDRAHVRGRL